MVVSNLWREGEIGTLKTPGMQKTKRGGKCQNFRYEL
jgi:hypothetical protein